MQKVLHNKMIKSKNIHLLKDGHDSAVYSGKNLIFFFVIYYYFNWKDATPPEQNVSCPK